MVYLIIAAVMLLWPIMHWLSIKSELSQEATSKLWGIQNIRKVSEDVHCGQRQKVVKGMRVILEGRGKNTAGKNPEWMHKKLASHRNIKHEMNLIEHLLRQKGYICVFLPKFHPEINPMRGYGLN